MNSKRLLIPFLVLAYSSICTVAAAAEQRVFADVVLFNGRIFAADASLSTVQALAINGDRIAAVGGNAAIKRLAGPQTRQVDLSGHSVIPGINDAHLHLSVLPPNTIQLSFKQADPTWDEVSRSIAQAAANSPDGSILMGEFGFALYFDPQVNRTALDKIAPRHSVILTCLTGHAVIANSAALSKLGITEEVPDPVGGRYERSKNGKLTGVIREYATLQVTRKLADLTSDAEAIRQLNEFFGKSAQFGITSIQDMSDAFAPNRLVALLKASVHPVRIRIMRMPLTSPAGRDAGEGLASFGHPATLIVVSGTKWMLDGTPFEGTLTPPGAWADIVRSSGDRVWTELPLTFGQTEMRDMLREALENKDQLLVHVSGYPAASAMLGALQATGGPAVWAGKRVRFEHGDGLYPDLVPLARDLGIIVVQNPSHFAAGVVAEKAFPLRSLLAAGIPVALGSDGPLNPYLNIMFAASHPARPSEAISREQAVVAYTRTAAYAEFAEREKGSLERGKLADLTVLSQNIFTAPQTELPKTTSILTIVGGKTVYDAGKLH